VRQKDRKLETTDIVGAVRLAGKPLGLLISVHSKVRRFLRIYDELPSSRVDTIAWGYEAETPSRYLRVWSSWAAERDIPDAELERSDIYTRQAVYVVVLSAC